MRRRLYVLIGTVVVCLLAYSMLYTVDETQYAILTTFGKPVKTVREAGLNFKLPAPAQSVLFFDKRLQIFDPRPTENLTLDRKNLVVDSFTTWRIDDPDLFLVKVRTMAGAENSLAALVASELSTEMGRHELSDLVSVNEQDVKLAEMMEAVTERCHKTALMDYGMDVRDVRIKRINLPTENKFSVYQRMRAERQQKAKEYRAQGEEQAMIIRGDTDQEKREIISRAYKEAQRIKGEGDAEAIRIYSKAYNQDLEFYKFLRTLEAYRNVLSKDTTVVMSSSSEFLKLLTGFDSSKFASTHRAARERDAQERQSR